MITSFPRRANSLESEYRIARVHCSVCRSEHEAAQSDHPSKICLARNGKEAFLAPDTSQILYFVGEMLPVDSSKCEHTLMIK